MATSRAKRDKKKTTLVNGGVTPVVYTDDGHTLAAGDRVDVDKVDGTARALIDRGFLIAEGEHDEVLDRDDEDKPGASDQESAS